MPKDPIALPEDLTPEVAPEASESVPAAPVQPQFDALVDGWFRQHFCDRCPAVDPDAYNIAYLAAQDLKQRLAALPTSAS